MIIIKKERNLKQGGKVVVVFLLLACRTISPALFAQGGLSA
jgi:hypothetical protein